MTHQNNITIAETYYQEMGKQNIAALEPHLDPEVQFIGPLAKLSGKEKVLEATKHFASMVKSLKIRGKFGSGDQTVIVYNVEFPEPIGVVSSTSLMTFKNGLVTKIELFYDARPFEVKREQIFGSKS